MASAGVAAGVDGVFMEVHEQPAQAKSDAQNALAARPARAAARSGWSGIHAIARRSAAAGRLTSGHDHRHRASALDLARKVLRTEAAAILGLVDRIDGDFERAVQLLFECRGRVIVTGMGKSGIICRKIAATLSSTGTSAWFLHPAEAIHGDLGAIREDDVVLALSHSGETEELLRLLESIRRIGARLIALTGDPALDARPRGRRDARLRHRRRSLPDEPGADREHDGRAGDGRRARDDAARPQGIPRGAVRVAASRAASSDAG